MYAQIEKITVTVKGLKGSMTHSSRIHKSGRDKPEAAPQWNYHKTKSNCIYLRTERSVINSEITDFALFKYFDG